MFCCKYRIYKNILKLLYYDLARLYKVCYACITEAIANLDKLNIDQAKKLKDMCENLAKLSEDTQLQVGAMLSQLKESMSQTISYFKVLLHFKNIIKSF